ncbi:DUF4397 domain-containing protein [Pedobacter sp. MC2016-24]|uniref:DUF4397 domain-containing protein n=1 Tax=Pedobacter sp. MC2016-24 TaxID=2780090 RepID=UPI0018805913|nr:DUF4397 domain-containing protein [Pedobacter sp. MC2016-24]MBE9600498.1 DUF4397 domain-containing protein [Pedobacter sp. MC2016-24]
MKIFSALSICALLFVIISCNKNVLDYGDVEKLGSDQALLKINYVSAYANNRSVAFKINDVRVSNVVTWRTPFPGGGYNTGGGSGPDFMAVNPGTVKLSVIVPFKKDNGLDSLELYSTNLQLVAGKNYVAHIADTTSSTKTFLTEENFVRPDTSYCRYRFVNLIPNVAAVDLYYGTSATDQTKDTLLAGNISYLNISNEIKLKSAQSKTWKIRTAGAAITSATILASYTSTSLFLNQRVYTAFACGYNGKTANAQKPYLSFFLIR